MQEGYLRRSTGILTARTTTTSRRSDRPQTGANGPKEDGPREGTTGEGARDPRHTLLSPTPNLEYLIYNF